MTVEQCRMHETTLWQGSQLYCLRQLLNIAIFTQFIQNPSIKKIYKMKINESFITTSILSYEYRTHWLILRCLSPRSNGLIIHSCNFLSALTCHIDIYFWRCIRIFTPLKWDRRDKFDEYFNVYSVFGVHNCI